MTNEQYQCDCGLWLWTKMSPSEMQQHDIAYHGGCGYCKCTPCQCDGFGGPIGNHGKCGYCHDYIMDDGCSCDGFGGSKA